jgi:collagenase-like PrtC family protease
MLPHLPQLQKAGIASLKIEGRMKTAYYVASVVSVYRRALDLLEKEGEEAFYAAVPALMTELEKSEISFVSTAAAELKRSMADSFIQMVSQMQLLYKDYKYNFMEVGIE